MPHPSRAVPSHPILTSGPSAHTPSDAGGGPAALSPATARRHDRLQRAKERGGLPTVWPCRAPGPDARAAHTRLDTTAARHAGMPPGVPDAHPALDAVPGHV